MPGKPTKDVAFFGLSPGLSLCISTALLAISFLAHIIFLFLVEPLHYLKISKEDAMLYSGAPLVAGVAFLLAAIVSFLKIETRTAVHIALLIIVAAFGMLTFQGLSGVVLHWAHISSHRV